MSEELEKALADFDWAESAPESKWRIHYDPNQNGYITDIVKESFSKSENPFIEVTEQLAVDFINGDKYSREYHVVNDVLTFKVSEHNTYKASDVRVGQLTKDSEIDTGVYFVTVRGEPDLVIDTIDVNEENLDLQSQTIKEYLENNDVYKDSE